MAEIQCLVGGYSAAKTPRRAADGYSLPRLQLLCAVIEKRLRLTLWNREIYLNVVGGLRISEPSADLATAITIISSLLGERIKAGSAFIGELGLGGDIRSGRQVESRIREAEKMGFKRVFIPKSASSAKFVKELQSQFSIEVIPSKTLEDVLSEALDTGVGVKDLLNNHRRRVRKQAKAANDGSELSDDASDHIDSNLYDTD